VVLKQGSTARSCADWLLLHKTCTCGVTFINSDLAFKLNGHSKVSDTLQCSVSEHTASDEANVSSVNENALFYVSGYVAKKYLDHHDCDKCSELLKSATAINELQGANTQFIKFKTFSESFGLNSTHGLLVPSENLVSHVRLCEEVFMCSFPYLMHMNKVSQRLLYKISSKASTQWCSSVDCLNVEKITQIYVKMRIHYCLKFFNRSLVAQPRHKRNSKMLKLQHL